jgi:hypothetical protein
MKHILFLLALLSVSAQSASMHKGEVIDSLCAKLGGHEVKGYALTKTNNPHDCTQACVNGHGAHYVLWDRSKGQMPQIPDQGEAARHAGETINAVFMVGMYCLTYWLIRKRWRFHEL